ISQLLGGSISDQQTQRNRSAVNRRMRGSQCCITNLGKVSLFFTLTPDSRFRTTPSVGKVPPRCNVQKPAKGWLTCCGSPSNGKRSHDIARRPPFILADGTGRLGERFLPR